MSNYNKYNVNKLINKHSILFRNELYLQHFERSVIHFLKLFLMLITNF